MVEIVLSTSILSLNKVMKMAATCGIFFMVYLARYLGATHVQEATDMAAYAGYAHDVQLCHNYDKVDLVEVMV